MKKIFLLYILVGSLLFSGCSEEQTYIFDGYEIGNLSFSAVNLSIGEVDKAVSMRTYYDERVPYENGYVSFDILYNYLQSDYEEKYQVNVRLDYVNQMWSGGNNELEFTFQPSCPEEKSAKFTMPDGSIHYVDIGAPSFKWTINRETILNSGYPDLRVVAESEYKVNGVSHKNIGYIYITVDTDLYYNNIEGLWYYNRWVDGEPLIITRNLSFDAVNLSVGDFDYAKSIKYNGSYYDNIWREETGLFKLDIHNTPDSSDPSYFDTREVRLDYTNVLWAGGDNDIEITYRRNCLEEVENTELIMPDGQIFRPTPTDSIFVWTLNQETLDNTVNWDYENLVIQANSNYEKDGVIVNASSYVLLAVDREVGLDKKNGLWYLNNWGYGSHAK